MERLLEIEREGLRTLRVRLLKVLIENERLRGQVEDLRRQAGMEGA